MAPTKRKCNFNDDLKSEFPFIKTTSSSNEVRCEKCLAHFSIANSGRTDIKQHLQTQKHKRADLAKSSSKVLTNFLRSNTFNDKEKDLAIVEGTWTFHSVQHNFSFRSNDCTSKLIKSCFNEKYSCARTKCESIVNNIFTPMSLNTIKADLSNVQCITIYLDCSNHKNVKICPILIRYFLPNKGIQIKILDVKDLVGETSDIISKYVQETLEKNEIISKMIAFCGDSTNCNFGGAARKGQNNIFHKMQNFIGQKLIGVNCAAHILNNCIQTAAECLPIDIEVIIVKIYSFFYIYTVRIENFKEICEDIEIEYKKLLGHSKTRWLTLMPALERIIKLFEALKLYFMSQPKCPTILRNFFMSPCAELWLSFAYSQASTFHKAILNIESQNISMPEASTILKDLKFKLVERKKDLFLPLTVKNIILELQKSNDFDETITKEHITNFYQTCIDYLNQWDKAFRDVEILYWILLRNMLSWDKIEKTLSYLNEFRNDLKINNEDLFDEVSCVKNFANNEKIEDWRVKNISVDERWIEIFNHFKKHVVAYKNILILVEFCLCLPASNAATERVFSIMNNIWTTEKSQLKVNTLRSLLITKCNFKMNCSEFKGFLINNPDVLKKIHSVEKYQTS